MSGEPAEEENTRKEPAKARRLLVRAPLSFKGEHSRHQLSKPVCAPSQKGALHYRLQTLGQVPPAWLQAGQQPGRLDEHATQLRVGRADQAGVGLALARRAVAGRQAAVTRQLLAAAEAVKASNLGPQRPGGDRANTLEGLQPADRVVGRGHLLETLFDEADLGNDPGQPPQALLQDPAGLLGQLGIFLQPGEPGACPAVVAAAEAMLA